jgi:hypothetical protein
MPLRSVPMVETRCAFAGDIPGQTVGATGAETRPMNQSLDSLLDTLPVLNHHYRWLGGSDAMQRFPQGTSFISCLGIHLK